MKKILIPILIGAVAIVAIVLLFASLGRTGEEKSLPRVESSSTERMGSKVPTDRGGEETSDEASELSGQIESPAAFAVAFYQAENALTALSEIAKARRLGYAEANDALLELDDVCSLSPQLEVQTWADRWLREYCAGYAPLDRSDGAMEHAIRYEMTADYLIRQEISDRLASTNGPDDRIEVFRQALSAAESPHQARSVLQFAAEEGGDALLGEAALGLSREQSQEALSLAAELLYCRSSGGCDQLSIYSVRACRALGDCDRPRSLYDTLRRNSSPRLFDAAMDFAEKYR